jgi:hypothetical protein
LYALCVLAVTVIATGGLSIITTSNDGTIMMGEDLAVAQEEPESGGLQQGQTFSAELSGAQELPPVNTNAAGAINITGSNQSIAYRFALSNMTNATAAHVHMGEENENGKVVLTLFKSESPSGVEIESLAGNATSDKLQGPLAGATLGDFIGIMDTGTAYVNVHTADFPNGEIRGELSPADDEEAEEGPEEEEEEEEE